MAATGDLSLATIAVTGQITSTLATGTAPLSVASTTLVTNLNADLLDGNHAAAFESALTKGNMTATSPIAVDQTREVIGGAVVISHVATAGNIHLPAAGSSNQLLKNSGVAGTGTWGTVTEAAGVLGAVVAIHPAADGVAALQIRKADGATVVATWDTTNNRMGINALPLVRLHLSMEGLVPHSSMYSTSDAVLFTNSGAAVQLRVSMAYTSAASSGQFVFLKARGTLDTPTAVVSGDQLSSILTMGHDGTNRISAGSILVICDGTVSSGIVPAAIALYTYPAGSAVERVRIASGGNVGIGTNNQQERLTLVSTGKLAWEASAGVVDTNLYRSAANVLKTDDALVVVGAFGCNGAAQQTAYASGGALAAYATGAYGLSSGAEMQALHALVVAMRAALVANGILS